MNLDKQKEKLIEIIKNAVHKEIFYTSDGKPVTAFQRRIVDLGEVKILADHLLTNGVIVPPCKVGDVVYIHWSRTKACAKKVYPVKVYALRWDTKAKDRRICVEGEFNIDAYDGSYTHYYRANFCWDKVGKTVFLSREDAEKALKE